MTRHATVCFSIGDGVQGGGNANPRRMQNGAGNPLWFQLFQDATRTTVWGSTFFGVNTPVMVNMTIPGRGNAHRFRNDVRTRAVRADHRGAGRLSGSVHRRPHCIDGQRERPSPPGSCSTSIVSSFPFTATANVVSQCAVSATSLDFGTVGLLLANTDGTSTLSVQCANGIAYQVGLSNGLNASGTTRRMSGPGGLVSYELYRNSTRTQRWGNTLNTDTVIGSGNGSSQSLTVYGACLRRPRRARAPTTTRSR